GERQRAADAADRNLSEIGGCRRDDQQRGKQDIEGQPLKRVPGRALRQQRLLQQDAERDHEEDREEGGNDSHGDGPEGSLLLSYSPRAGEAVARMAVTRGRAGRARPEG